MSLSKITKSVDATGSRNGVKGSMLTSARRFKWSSSPIYNRMSKFGALMKRARKNSKKRGKATVKDIPAKIWEIIIDHLNDFQDWLNLYRTCKYFTNLMEKNKAASLFPEVIKILSDRADDLKLSGEDFIYFRLEGKCWSKSVNTVNSYLSHHSCIQDLLFFDKYDEYEYAYTKSVRPSFPMVFSVIEDSDFKKMDDILTQMESDKSVVLFGRHLILKGLPYHWEHEQDFEKTEEKKETVLSFLKEVGPSIWHLGVDPSDEEYLVMTADWFETLISILLLLPNLKSFYIGIGFMGYTNYTANNEFSWEQELTAKYKIPYFPYLQVLQFDKLPEVILKPLLLSNNHIKKLTLDNCCRNFQCVHSLSETFFNSAEIVESVRNIEEFSFGLRLLDMETHIRTLQSFNWPLTKVDIYANCLLPAEILFQSLERFGATLTHLRTGRVVVPENWSIQFDTGFPKLRFMALRLENRREDFATEEIKQMVMETLKCLEDVEIKIEGYDSR